MAYWISGLKILVLYNQDVQISFNSAFLLFLSSILVYLLHKKWKGYKIIINLLALFILGFSLFSLYNHSLLEQSNIDSFFISGFSYKGESPNMSIITSLSFIIFSLASIAIIIGNITFVKIFQYLYFFLPVTAVINIVSKLLQTVIPGKIGQVETMSIEASASFLILSYLLLLNFPKTEFKKIVLGKSIGSKFLRSSIPFVTLIPFSIGYIVLAILDKEIISSGFGIILYTVGLMLTGFITLYFTSYNINKSVYLRREAEKKLVNKNKELSLFKDALDKIAIIALVDKDYKFKKVNDNFCKFTGLEKSEIYGKTNDIIKSDEHDQEFFDTIWKTIRSGKVWIGEIKNKVYNNQTSWTNTAIVPVKNKGSKDLEYITIKFDISEKKEFEEMLESSYVKKLRNKNKEIEQFTYITSHDLQEPLRTIESLNEILRTEYVKVKDEKVNQIFTFIDEATSRMSNLIKNLLDYSLIGKSDELEEINFNKLLDELILDLKPMIKEHNGKVEFKNLPTLQAYPVSIKILLKNLISNGLKFSKPKDKPTVKVYAEQKEKVWEFCVEDNGIGIKEKHQEKIFSIFQTLHLKEDYDGTGIGLAHCQKIVALHEGDIWVKSKVNEGSRFYFTLPILKT